MSDPHAESAGGSHASAGPEGSGDAEDLRLSPSETMAHNSAMRVAGASRGGQSTQRALASIVLGFELIIVVLIGLTLFGLGTLEPRELGLFLGGGLAVVIVAGLALMRRGRAGIVTGWIVHALMLLTAFLLPMALVVGLLFTALWVFCMVKGSQIDRNREAWLAEQADA
ncbi:DUF4233 domain-containing protein [Leucobacter zeae]|nr:DUF4233 domain-containing protein [Leucobacter zeae]